MIYTFHAQSKKGIALTMLLFFFSVRLLAQSFTFPSHELSVKKTASDIKAHGTFPLYITVDGSSYIDVVTDPTDWFNKFKIKSAQGFVKFYIDHSFPTKEVSSYRYGISFIVTGYTNATTSTTFPADTLVISYNPDSLATYQDMVLSKYSGFHRLVIAINSIYDLNASPIATIPPSSLTKLNFVVEGSILTQQYDKKKGVSTYYTFYGNADAPNTDLHSSGSIVSASDYADIKWNILSYSHSYTVPIEPANFELEWLYVDNYKKNIETGDITEISPSDLSYDFRHNATRVWLDKNNFKIPLIYQKGYLVYRVRMVRPDSNFYRYPIYGQWNAPDNGTVSSLTEGENYLEIDQAHKNDSVNWQYTVSFAENGKYKHVLSYFDGLLKNRQSITRFNGAPDRLIATEQVYDYEGRPAISILPTPVQSSAFTYQPGLSLNALTGLPYQASDFDTIHTATCPAEYPPAPLHSDALANIYYSSSNPDQAGVQKFVPDAGGYPFVQTIYSAGYDKRIDRQGGAGDTLQIGFGHDTYNDYVASDQKDLNRMFGIDVGWSGYYRKTVTTDPNGQISMSVQDFRGKQVASAMIGRGPNAVIHAIIPNDNVPDSSFRIDELIEGMPQSIDNHTKILNRDFYMDVSGNDSIQYVFEFTPMYVCPSTYLSVRALYFYEIFDQCGTQELYVEDTIGTTGVMSTGSVVSDAEPMRGVFLTKGKHSLRKELTINESDVYAAVDSLMKDPPACFKTEHNFIKEAVLEEEFPCDTTADPCGLLKKQMMDELWPRKKYGMYSRTDWGRVLGTDNSIFTIYRTPAITGHGFYDTSYRYEKCTDIVFPGPIWKAGKVYTTFVGMSPDTLMYIFNDAIAEALLPLHPEYCKLLNCYSDNYKEVLESFPSAAVAVANHRFDIDSIIKYDPILPKLSSGPLYFTDASDSLATYRGGFVGIDTMALMMAYCNCSDSLMAVECFNRIFKSPIYSLSFADAKLKDAYYKILISGYFANRERFKSYLLAAAGSCEPCSTYRMTLIPDPVFTSFFTSSGEYDFSGTGYFGTLSLSDFTKRLMSHDASSMTLDSMYAYGDTAKLKVDSVNLAVTTAKVDSVIATFANCTPLANLSAVADTLMALAARTPVMYGRFTPDHIRYALLQNGISLTDLCNPYIISYDYNDSRQMPAGIACKAPAYYDNVKEFLNKESIEALVEATSSGTSSFHNFTLNTVNAFEYEVYQAFSTLSMKLYATVNADTSLYIVHVMPQTAPTDTMRLYFEINKRIAGSVCKNILAHSTTPTLDTFEFLNVKCIAENYARSLGTGYIVNMSFVSDIQKKVSTTSIANCELISWNDRIKMMGTATGLEQCIPCTQMYSLYKEFADTMTAYGVLGTDHPYQPIMLRNFMNDKLNRIFDGRDYTRFIESCALADSLPMYQYNGYASIVFPSDADANTFMAYINATDTVYLDYFLRYKKDDSVRLLLDFRSLPPHKFLSVRNHIAAYATTAKVNHQFNPTEASDFMGWIINYKGTPFDSTELRAETTINAVFDVNAGEEIDFWTGRRYVKYISYPVFAKSGVTNMDIAAAIAATNKYLSDSTVAAYFINRRLTTTDKEYASTEKQAYLQHVFQYYDKQPYQVLDYIQAAALESVVYPGRSPQYGSSSGIPDINNLYLAQSAHPGLTKAQYIFTQAKSYFGGNVVTPASFPSDRTISIIGSNVLNLYQCGDRTLWYRYFGTGDTMFNVFFRMPLFIPQSDYDDYSLTEVIALPGMGESRALRLKFEKGSDEIYVKGFTDYTVGNSQILHDVLLTNAFGVEQPVDDTIDNCERTKLNSAIRLGKENYRLYLDSMKMALRKTFYDYVMSHIGEKLYLGYRDQRFNYTLYYYDRAGNLIRTIPPAGVKTLSNDSLNLVNTRRTENRITVGVLPAHTKASVYEYNTLDKVIRQSTPDGGEVNYLYDQLGRVIYSQNKKQALKEAYTYTFYDAQGRVTETGEVDLYCGFMTYMYREGFGTIDSFWTPCIYMWSEGTPGKYGFPPYYSTRNPYIHNAHAYTEEQRQAYLRTKNRADVVCTIYDTVAKDISVLEGINEQENLRKRVTCIKYFEKLPSTDTFYKNYTYATHYSYDIAGNVKTLVHDYPTLEIQKQRYKTVDYDYDLASGKVNMLSYNRGWGDQYYQRYSYDDDNRITQVETSADGFIWKRDAGYEYYQHGPLARASIGDLRVQGIDFAYTIQGWLKAVNGDILNPAYEMGQDSMLNNVHAYDAAATAIDYFKGDYKPIGAMGFTHTAGRTQGLYNGNISRIATDLLPFNPLMANFTYDQLNRIKYAAYDSMSPIVSGVSTLYPTPAYYSNYKYDADGNINKLIRRANKPGAAMIMDSMTYYYRSVGGPNQLVNITDSADNNYIDDVDKFLEPIKTRYQYDAIGNVTKDMVSNQDTIQWNLYNKVTRTENHTAKDKMRFVYDGAGHRVAKFYSTLNDDNTVSKERNEYFVHDAQGNILAVYKHQKDYAYESLRLIPSVITEVSAWMRTGLGTSTYLSEVIARSFVSDADFEAAIEPYVIRHGDSHTPSPVSLYLSLDRHNTELLMSSMPDWIDSLRDYGPEMGNPTVVSAPLATSYVDRNYEFSKHIMHTFMSTPDTLKRRQVLAAAAITLGDAGMDILRNTNQLLDISYDNTMDANTLARNIVVSERDVNRIGEAVSVNMIAAKDTVDYISYFDYLLDPGTSILSDAFYDKTMPHLFQTALVKYGEREFLEMFFSEWSHSYQRLVNLAGKPALFMSEYHADPVGYLTAVTAGLGDDILDTALAAMPDLTLDILHDRAYGAMDGASIATLDALPEQAFPKMMKEQVLLEESFDLAEHHLYGSSRLGIKNYYSKQIFGYWMRRLYSGLSSVFLRDTGALLDRSPWYSAQLNDAINKDQKIAFDHTDNNRYQLGHVLGQKQYEVTNHLGNVLSTISDNRYEKMLGSGSGPKADTIQIFAPAVTASYDYYPFGMLMPGRYLAADTVTELVDILRYEANKEATYSILPLAGGAGSIGGGTLYTISGDVVKIVADTIGAGMLSAVTVTAGHATELEIDASMLLGDPMRASVYEMVRDDNDEMHERELASVIMTMEGKYKMDFVPADGSVYLKVVYSATGLDGTTSASAGDGGAGAGPAGTGGKGYSASVIGVIVGDADKVYRWRYVKVVKNPKDYYRFGHNGQEKDNEIYGRGTHYYAPNWEYDARTARRWNLDPKPNSSVSSYAVFGNSPIQFADPLGDTILIREFKIVRTGSISKIEPFESAFYHNGRLYDKNGSLYTGKNNYIISVKNDLQLIENSNSEIGASIIKHLDNSKSTHIIGNIDFKSTVEDVQSEHYDFSNYCRSTGDGGGTFTKYNLKDASWGYDVDKKISTFRYRDRKKGLMHELSHAFDFDIEKFAQKGDPDGEGRAVSVENTIEGAGGKRSSHGHRKYSEKELEEYRKSVEKDISNRTGTGTGGVR